MTEISKIIEKWEKWKKEEVGGGKEYEGVLNEDCTDEHMYEGFIRFAQEKLQQKLADKDKELDDLCLKWHEDNMKNIEAKRELRSKIKELTKKIWVVGDKCWKDGYRQANFECRKKIEEIKDEIGKIYYACNDERVFEIQKRLGELGKSLLENGSSKLEEVGNRESHSPSTVKEDHLSSDDVKPSGKDFLEKFASQTTEEIKESGKKIMKKYKGVFDGLAKS